MTGDQFRPIKQYCKLTGVEVTPISVDDLIATVRSSLLDERFLLISGHNLHSAYLYNSNKDFRRAYRIAEVVLADGAPIVIDYKISGGRRAIQRVGSTDWITVLLQTGCVSRLAVVGASERSNQRFLEFAEATSPNIEVLGFPGESWNEQLAQRVVPKLMDFKPQLTLIGLGMPLQEELAQKIYDRNFSGVIATVGGAIDQLSGEQRNAPRWMGPLGLEWLWRLATQPRRLWRRYLLEPWKLLVVRVFRRVT